MEELEKLLLSDEQITWKRTENTKDQLPYIFTLGLKNITKL